MNTFCEVSQILRKRVSKGMTLPEMLCFIVLVVCVIVGGKFGRQIIGSWYGYLLGGILGVISGVVCVFVLAFLMHLFAKNIK